MSQGSPSKQAHTVLRPDRNQTIETGPQGNPILLGDQERFLTAVEIAPRLGFSVRRVREYAAAGKIPAVRLNRRDLRFHWPTVVRRLAGS